MIHETLRLLPDGRYDPEGCGHRDASYQPNCSRHTRFQVRGVPLCGHHYARLEDAAEWRRLVTATRLEAWER
jgi:hypothetical protein